MQVIKTRVAAWTARDDFVQTMEYEPGVHG